MVVWKALFITSMICNVFGIVMYFLGMSNAYLLAIHVICMLVIMRPPSRCTFSYDYGHHRPYNVSVYVNSIGESDYGEIPLDGGDFFFIFRGERATFVSFSELKRGPALAGLLLGVDPRIIKRGLKWEREKSVLMENKCRWIYMSLLWSRLKRLASRVSSYAIARSGLGLKPYVIQVGSAKDI